MPGTVVPPSELYERGLYHLGLAVHSLTQRQSTIIRDDSQTVTDPSTGKSKVGPVVMALGQIPNGMPTSNPFWESAARPLYGHAIYNRNTGKVVAHYGSQPDGSHGMWAFDSSQNHRLKVGEVVISGTTYYGMGVYDTSGDLIGMIGQLPGGENGFAVYDASGKLQCQIGVLPDGTFGIAQLARQGVSSGELVDIGLLCSPVVESNASTVSTTSTAYQGSDQVQATATVGSSGTAVVDASGLVYVSNTNATGYVGLFVDGTDVKDGILTMENNSGGGVGFSGSGRFVVTGLSAGSHTFGLRSRTTLTSVSVSVTDWVVTVQPY